MKFISQHEHYEHLRKKWIQKQKNILEKFWENHADFLRHLTLGGLGSLVILSTPGMKISPSIQKENYTQQVYLDTTLDKRVTLSQSLAPNLPDEVTNLSPSEETKIAGTLSDKFGFQVEAEMNGIRLNRTYGLIGGEQHLYRYPGDTLLAHFESLSDWAMFAPAGIAPHLGAWGYFAPSKPQFTTEEKNMEKYYIAVQTFLSPGYAENPQKYNEFFKYRKMLIVNPKTGQAVVADIADAGPSEWTGKQLGGSPEVMYLLGLGEGPRKGGVLYFFINDPSGTIPLGPIEPKK